MNIIEQYRDSNVYDGLEDPGQLRGHLYFNKGQYEALKVYDEDLMNCKDREIVQLKQSDAQTQREAELVKENNDLRRELEKQKREYEVMESGYQAVKQYLENGRNFIKIAV